MARLPWADIKESDNTSVEVPSAAAHRFSAVIRATAQNMDNNEELHYRDCLQS